MTRKSTYIVISDVKLLGHLNGGVAVDAGDCRGGARGHGISAGCSVDEMRISIERMSKENCE